MREFFRGWRRKIGAVTLVMALALTGVWMRSVVIEDSLTAQCENLIVIHMASKCQGLVWTKLQETNGPPQHPRFVGYPYGYASRKNSVGPFDSIDGYSSQRRWQFCGFRFEQAELESPVKIQLTIRVIPYWSVVVTLTLLSAFFLLTKPRQ